MRAPASMLVLISARGGGDWPPVMALASGLRNRGHRVAVVCDVRTEEMVAAAGLSTICVPPELEQGLYFERYSERLAGSGLPPTYPFADWAQDCMPSVRASIDDTPPDLIVSSLFCMGLADLLASELTIPWCFVNPAFYFGEGSARSWEEDFLGPGVSVFRDLFLPLSQRATQVLHSTDPQFDFQPERLPPNHHYTGPLLWEMPAEAPSYLCEPGSPWVLVALSTVPQEGELAIARAAMRALTDEPVRVLVTLASGHDPTELEDIPQNVQLAEYIPHGPVLKDSRLVMSHAGHGIVMKALYYGVPMVLVPWGRDQSGVAARAEALGVALVISRDDLDDASVERAIRRVLDDPHYGETVQAVSRRLQSEDSVAVACEHLETLLSGAS